MELKVIRLDEVEDDCRESGRWGLWAFDNQAFTLTFPPTGYWIDLDSCTNAAQFLDWILQISHKTWAPPSVVGELVTALDCIFGHRLQGKVCPWGENRHIEPRRLAKA